MGLDWEDLDPRTWWKQVKKGLEKDLAPSDEEKQKQNNLNVQGQAAGDFANAGQTNFGQLGVEAFNQRKRLEDQALGKTSVSAEMLRQGLQQQLGQQRSMAAGAGPQNAAMAARTAANNMGRASYGMSGQAALAGMQEKQAAEKALTDMIMGQRQQEMQVALGSRQNAISGYGGTTPDKSLIDKVLPAAQGALQAYVMSDRNAKHDIEDGDEKAMRILRGLRAQSYRYNDPKEGSGPQLGVMAQDLEKGGLQGVVRDTQKGKMVDGGKLALANTAMVAALGRRLSELERKKEHRR